MESVNLVVMSGQIEQSAVPFLAEDGREACNFSLKTFKSSGKGKDKIRTPQVHVVTMFNPGTIGRFLQKGKPVMLQGRLEPCPGSPTDMIVATSVHFPMSDRKPENE